MWDHVIYATPVFRDRRIHPTRYKASMYGDRSEVFSDAIARRRRLIAESLPRARGAMAT